MSVYGSEAQKFYNLGFNPLPVGANKRPCIQWRPWQDSRMGPDLVSRLVARFPDTNVGVPTGRLSGISVVDVDDSTELDWALATFGSTKLMATTPRGNSFHLYYRYSGERNATKVDGRAVDIRGQGGFIILPPSANEAGPYSLVEGSWDDLTTLNPMWVPSSVERIQQAPERVSEGVSRGERNSTLFDALRLKALHADSFDQLLDYGRQLNGSFTPPLFEAEVNRTTRSVWGYREQGSLLVPGQQRVVLPAECDELSPDALWLLVKLKASHRLSQDFALSIKAMARSIGWTERRLRKAREELIQSGMLMLVKKGGRGEHDPSMFKLAP
jgi:hypothetical protein